MIFFKNLDGRKFLEGLPEHVTAWGEIFMIRRHGDLYYISMKNGPWRVQGTEYFSEWLDARMFINSNWRRLYDDEFERLVLDGAEQGQTNVDDEILRK